MAGLVAVPLFLFMYGARSGGAEAGYIPTAKSALIGRKGVAVSDLAPSGRVRVADEEWTATTDLGDVISEGEDVRVIGVYGDVLKVSKDHKDFPQEEK
jgi:membrane-bound ClpP family serine protease